MAITAAMVKELREMTGAGMMDCKKALTNTDGDMMKVRNLGRKSLEEVLAKLKELNLELNHGEE